MVKHIHTIESDVKVICGIKGFVHYDKSNPTNLTTLKVDWFARCQNTDGYIKLKNEAAVREIVGDESFEIMHDQTVQSFIRKVLEHRQYQDTLIFDDSEAEE